MWFIYLFIYWINCYRQEFNRISGLFGPHRPPGALLTRRSASWRPWIPATRSACRSSVLIRRPVGRWGTNRHFSRSTPTTSPREDDNVGVDETKWSRAGWINSAPWMTGTTRRPGTATWTCWRRLLGRISTHRMRMAWHRRYGLLITATWRLCGWSWRGGGYIAW